MFNVDNSAPVSPVLELPDEEMLRKQEFPGFWSRTSMIQLGYGVWVGMVIVGVGMAFGFSAVTLPQLSTDDSIRTPNDREKAWIASVVNLTAPLGCLISGWIMDKCGRKPALILCQVPMAIGWFYIWYATAPTDIIVGRTISGIGCGMASSAPRPYITEISLPNMRASIGVLITLAISLGYTLEASMGAAMSWRAMSFVGGIYSIIFFGVNWLLPETPYYTLMTSTLAKARKCLTKFRGKDYDIGNEMNSLLYFRDVKKIRRLSTKEAIKTLFTSLACTPFWIIFPYVVFSQASGITAVLFYTLEILQECNSSVDASIGNILMGITRIVFGVIISILLFKARRRPLALISSIGVSLTCFTLFAYLKAYPDAQTIFPICAFICYVALATVGYYSLPILIAFELIPLQIRGTLGGIILALTNLSMFGAVHAFPFVNKMLTLPYTILCFGIISAICAVFLFFVLPETKGLTLMQLEEFFRKPVEPSGSGTSIILSSTHVYPWQKAVDPRRSKDEPRVVLERYFKDEKPSTSRGKR